MDISLGLGSSLRVHPLRGEDRERERNLEPKHIAKAKQLLSLTKINYSLYAPTAASTPPQQTLSATFNKSVAFHARSEIRKRRPTTDSE